MWDLIKKYASIYKENFSTSLAESTSYRINFILSAFMEATFCLTTIASISLIFDHVPKIGPWNETEFLFFISFALLVNQLHMSFVSINFWMFSEYIILGTLDFKLLKPVGAIFLVFFRYIRIPALPNILFTVYLLAHFGNQLDFGPLDWLLIPPLVLASLTLMVSLEMLMMMSNFWLLEGSGVNFLRMQFQQLSCWPDFVFNFFFRKLFSLGFPILLVNSVPVKFLFDHSQWTWLLTLTLAILTSWVAIHFAWKLGLQQYESASS